MFVDKRLCSSPESGSIAPGHIALQDYYPVLRMGHDQDEGSNELMIS